MTKTPGGADSHESILLPASEHNLSFLSAVNSYYNGDFQEALDCFKNILSQDPENVLAREYVKKAGSDLANGIVPNKRLPTDALQIRDQGHVFQTTGQYKQARKQYILAQNIARKAGIQLWKAIQDDLKQINILIKANNEKELLSNLAKDGKFELVLTILNEPVTDSFTQRPFELKAPIRTALEVEEIVNLLNNEYFITVQSAMEQLLVVRMKAAFLKNTLPENDRLQQTDVKINNLTKKWVEFEISRAQSMIALIQGKYNLHERVALIETCTSELQTAAKLAPDSLEIENLLETSLSESRTTKTVLDEFKHIEAYLEQNRKADLLQARQSLLALRDYRPDPVYRKLASALQHRLFEHVITELKNPPLTMENHGNANYWLSLAEDDLLHGPGSRDTIYRFKSHLRLQERKLSRNKWQRIIFLTFLAFTCLSCILSTVYFPVIKNFFLP